MAKGGQPRHQRAPRQLVRWNDNLDKKLLLAIQSACSQEGIVIPWVKVAKHLEIGATDGAIVQHLSKLRTNMAKAGLHTPHSLRRGTGRSTISQLGNPPKHMNLYKKAKKQNVSESDDDSHADKDFNADPDQDYGPPLQTFKRSKPNRFAKGTKLGNLGSEDGSERSGSSGSPIRTGRGSRFLQLEDYKQSSKVWTIRYLALPKVHAYLNEDSDDETVVENDDDVARDNESTNGSVEIKKEIDVSNDDMTFAATGYDITEPASIYPKYDEVPGSFAPQISAYGFPRMTGSSVVHPQDVVFAGHGQTTLPACQAFIGDGMSTAPNLDTVGSANIHHGMVEPDAFTHMWQDGGFDQYGNYDDAVCQGSFGSHFGAGNTMLPYSMPFNGGY